MDKQITAVEFLLQQLPAVILITKQAEIAKALEMEKEQIIQAYEWDRMPCGEDEAEQYYQQIYING